MEKLSVRNRTVEQLQERGIVAGSPGLRSGSSCKRLEEAGLERVMLQWLDLDDMEGLEALAKSGFVILPSQTSHG
jgi:hypothetical protein